VEIYGGLWRFVVSCSELWRVVASCSGLWRFAADCGELWRVGGCLHVLKFWTKVFLGASRNCKRRQSGSSCRSVYPYGTIRVPVDGF